MTVTPPVTPPVAPAVTPSVALVRAPYVSPKLWGSRVAHGMGSRVARGIGSRVARGMGSWVACGMGSRVARGMGSRVARGIGSRVARGIGSRVARGYASPPHPRTVSRRLQRKYGKPLVAALKKELSGDFRRAATSWVVALQDPSGGLESITEQAGRLLHTVTCCHKRLHPVAHCCTLLHTAGP